MEKLGYVGKWGGGCFSHLSDNETEAQKRWISCPRSPAKDSALHDYLTPGSVTFPLYHTYSSIFWTILIVWCWDSTLKDEAPALLGSAAVQIRSVAQSCPTLCDPMNRSTPGLPVHHQLPEFTQTQVHQVSDAIQPSHPLLSPSPPALNPSQHQNLFQWVNSSHEVAKVLEFQL